MKKKLLSIVLLLALVLALVATVVACEQPEAQGAEAAKEKLVAFYKNDTERFKKASYSLVGTVKLDGGDEFTVTWTCDNANVKITPNGRMVDIVVTKTAEDQTYTLTATIAKDGDTATATFAGSIEKDPNADGKLGSTYYMFVNQSNSGKLIWMTGEFDSSYNQLKTNDSKDAAIAWFAEDIANSQAKKIYFVENNANTYLGVAAGQYTNLSLVDAAANAAQWTIAADGTFKTTVDESEFFLGVNGTYNTVSLRPIGDLGIYMPAQLTTTPDAVKATATIKASELNEYSAIEFTSPAAANGGVTAEVGSTVKFKVNPDNGCTVTSVKVGGKTVTATEGVYSATLEKNCTIAVAVDNPNARAEYLNATIAVGARTSGSAAQSVWAIEGATLTSIKGDSNTDCYATEGRFYSKSTIKLECDGMLRVVLTTKTGYNEGLRGVEIFDTNGTKIEGAKVLVDGTTTVILFNEAVDAFVTGKLSAQVRITEVKIYTGEDKGLDQPTKPEHAGTAADPFTATDALIKGQLLELEPGKYSQDSFVMEAYIVGIKVATVSGNTVYDVDLGDAAGGAKKVALYHGNLATGSGVPYLGDKVRVVGHMQNYNGNYQFSGSTKAYPDGTDGVFATVEVLERGDASIKEAASNQNSTVNITGANEQGVLNGKNGDTATFTVAAADGYKVASVKVAGKAIEANEGVYSVTLASNMEIVVDVLENSAPVPEKLYTVVTDYTSVAKETNSYASSTTITSGGLTLNCVNFNTGTNNAKTPGNWDHIRTGNKSSKINANLSTTTALTQKITSIVINFADDVQESYVEEVYLEVSSTADFATVTTVDLVGAFSGASVQFNIANPQANMYYRIVFKCAIISANGLIHVKSVEFFGYAEAATQADAPAAQQVALPARNED